MSFGSSLSLAYLFHTRLSACLYGWVSRPDDVERRTKRLIFAELKREKGKVSESQKIVLSELGQLVQCEVYVWRPSDWDSIIEIMKGKP